MAGGWVKSLQCKSRALDDVVYQPKHKTLIQSGSCRKSVQSLKDVIDTTKTQKQNRRHKKPNPSPQPKPETRTRPTTRIGTDLSLPALTELPEGHPSRNVVEIIFHTSWSPKAFSGRVEMIFKVQNGSRAVTRFEEYREAVMSRAGSGQDPRCVADGNEVMGFHCLGPSSFDACGGAWVFPGGAAVCTYSGSGGAHESAGGGRGVRAMLVCRVVAGRVSEKLASRVGSDSVSGENGELRVFDSRAVLPCFLIIYKL